MIIWLNGAFGVGKTTTAEAVCAQRPGPHLFDPETVGSTLMANLDGPAPADFQDLESWRELVPAVAAAVSTERAAHLVAAQTVLEEAYWTELRRGFDDRGIRVVHVVLDASERVLHERIEADEIERQAVAWRLGHVARYAAAKSWLIPAADIVVDTSSLHPEAVTARILADVAAM